MLGAGGRAGFGGCAVCRGRGACGLVLGGAWWLRRWWPGWPGVWPVPWWAPGSPGGCAACGRGGGWRSPGRRGFAGARRARVAPGAGRLWRLRSGRRWGTPGRRGLAGPGRPLPGRALSGSWTGAGFGGPAELCLIGGCLAGGGLLGAGGRAGFGGCAVGRGRGACGLVLGGAWWLRRWWPGGRCFGGVPAHPAAAPRAVGAAAGGRLAGGTAARAWPRQRGPCIGPFRAWRLCGRERDSPAAVPRGSRHLAGGAAGRAWPRQRGSCIGPFRAWRLRRVGGGAWRRARL